MESRFVAPVLISTALYALVFWLGSGHGPAPIKPPATTVTTLPTWPPLEVTREEPDRTVEADQTAETVRGRLEEFMPHVDEPPARIDGDLVIPAMPAPPPERIVGRIFDGPPGDPNGTSNGLRGVRVVSVKLLDNPPKTRVQVAPEYPPEARSQGLTGEVLVEFVVDELGRVLNAHVLGASDSRFEENTLRAVGRWRFEPGKKDGVPVRFRMVVPVVFSLDR